MKKILSFILLFVLLLSLCACGKTEAAKNADNLILSIGTVSLTSEKAIIDAENAVSQLSEKEKDTLENEQILISARTTFDALKKVDEQEKALIAEKEAQPEIPINYKKAISAVNKAKSDFKKYLNDPESLSILGVTIVNDPESITNTAIAKIDYNAANGFGGKVKNELYLYVFCNDTEVYAGSINDIAINSQADRRREYNELISKGASEYEANIDFVFDNLDADMSIEPENNK